MQAFARWIARRLWWGSLWLMRRRWIRRLQTASFRWLPAERAERARRGLARQNALARRIGLRMLTLVVLAVMVSIAVQLVYVAALYLVSSGVLQPRTLPQG